MATDPRAPVVDVSGLPPAAVRAVESFVTGLRSTGEGPVVRRPTDEEFERALRELASGPAGSALPADWSRADLYDS